MKIFMKGVKGDAFEFFCSKEIEKPEVNLLN